MQEGQEITQVIVDLNNRIRTLENKYNLLGERLLVVNQNMIEEYKRLLREMKIINEDLREMRQETMLTQDAMRNMVKEMELFAKKEQVRVLEKYIDLINPMRFVTTEEVESLIIQKSAGVKRGK
ncbi:hypothetical protein J4208_02710 [Candidatus Woesearchaeota archaeon]|nr:hypothetical protein [Candidatus Woesearchaeota archaeon]